MRNTTPADAAAFSSRRGLLGLLAVTGLDAAAGTSTGNHSMTGNDTEPLSPMKLALGPIAAATAVGDMARLAPALARGLDAGLNIGQVKETLVQMYAYAGFPRSLNGLGALMKVLEERRARGIRDTEGAAPGPVPVGAQLLETGTANQTRLVGAPVAGPLFDFAPAIDQFLKTHLFGDIFARDNLDWQSRELATVGALAAMSGVDSQLASHVRISLNVGLGADQLVQSANALAAAGFQEAADRLRAAVGRLATDAARR